MSNLEQRENRRKSIVANMVNEPEQPATSGRGRPKENREKKKSVTLSLLPSLHEDIQKLPMCSAAVLARWLPCS